jgi:hypothetical protein
MNTPVTAWPWSRRSMAATDESTPPDMPTMTRVGDEGDELAIGWCGETGRQS